MGETGGNKPIVRLTSFSVRHTPTGWGKNASSKSPHYTVYGVDEDGLERIYAEHTTEEEHSRWMNSDPLWKEYQGAMIKRLLDNPGTRDTVLQINIQGAINKGDYETAAELFMALSPETQRRVLGPEEFERWLRGEPIAPREQPDAVDDV